MSTVLVTGATGFVALHCVGQLLDRGYAVIGTVRSQDKADKLLKSFKEKMGSKADKLSLSIVADIADPSAFDEAFKSHPEIKYVLHTASPFTIGYTDFEKSYYTPAVNGTLGVLKAIQAHGANVERVVVTSSMAAILNFDKMADPTFIHDETVWNNFTKEQAANAVIAYCISKTLAERAAWNFLKENKTTFTLTTVNPSYVFGPQFFDKDAAAPKLNESSQIIKSLLQSQPGDEFPNDQIQSVDVRDVAKLHIIALENDAVQGHRLFATDPGATLSRQTILNIIREKFPQLKDKIATGNPDAANHIQSIGFSNEKTVALLGGYKFIPYEQQIVDSVQQILDVDSQL